MDRKSGWLFGPWWILSNSAIGRSVYADEEGLGTAVELSIPLLPSLGWAPLGTGCDISSGSAHP